MQDEVIAMPLPHKRVPWNKGKLTEAKAMYPSPLSGTLSSGRISVERLPQC